MSSLRNAISRRAHKERAQPQERKKFGFLEKHKDYVIRAKSYHRKEDILQKLKEKAAFRNPDEFYFKMIRSRTVDGVHERKDEGGSAYTPEEQMLFETQDMGYIHLKIQSEKKKIDRLSSTLHHVDRTPSNKHTYYAEDREEAEQILDTSATGNPSNSSNGMKMNMKMKKKVKASYNEVAQRKRRLDELERVYADMALGKELRKKGIKCRRLREDELVIPTTRPVYRWASERKR